MLGYIHTWGDARLRCPRDWSCVGLQPTKHGKGRRSARPLPPPNGPLTAPNGALLPTRPTPASAPLCYVAGNKGPPKPVGSPAIRYCTIQRGPSPGEGRWAPCWSGRRGESMAQTPQALVGRPWGAEAGDGSTASPAPGRGQISWFVTSDAHRCEYSVQKPEQGRETSLSAPTQVRTPPAPPPSPQPPAVNTSSRSIDNLKSWGPRGPPDLGLSRRRTELLGASPSASRSKWETDGAVSAAAHCDDLGP